MDWHRGGQGQPLKRPPRQQPCVQRSIPGIHAPSRRRRNVDLSFSPFRRPGLRARRLGPLQRQHHPQLLDGRRRPIRDRRVAETRPRDSPRVQPSDIHVPVILEQHL